MVIKNIKKALMLSCIAATTAFSTIANAATLDLLVVYDTYSKNYFGGDPNTAMINWVNQINAAYRDSQVDIQLRLVGVRENNQNGADQGAVLGNLRLNNSVIALRDQLGADFVAQVHQTGSCGVGYVAVDKNWTWNVVSPGCGPMTLAHELGHNMGLNHSRRQGDTTGTRYRYGVGYGVDSSFVTIMAYSQSFNNAPRQNLFSNPNITCKGVRCGVPEGQDQESYAAKALHNVRDEMAGFRPTAGGTNGNGPIKIFQNCDFQGYSAGLSTGTYTLGQLQGFGVKNDDISSIQVPAGYKVTLYNDDNFGGSSVVLTGNDSCLVGRGFNDLISSVRIESVSAGFSTTVQAENYSSNNGVQLEGTSDTGGGQSVGYIDSGDWMAYNSISIPTSGTYYIDYRVASATGGGKLSLDLNGGATVLGSMDIPNTGGWQNWHTITQTVNINAGTYNFGIYASAGSWNINWFRIRK